MINSNRHFVFSVGLIAIAASIGCSQPAGQNATPPAKSTSTTGMVNFEVAVTLPSDGMIGLSEGFGVTAEGHELRISGGNFFVDRTSYGHVNRGDQVRIESDGRILVNDRPREAVADAPSENGTPRENAESDSPDQAKSSATDGR